jgi:hypothetical protein
VNLAAARYAERLRRRIGEDAEMQALVDAVHRREIDPITAARRLASHVLGEASSSAPDAR